ncbi:MAG: nucleoid-associated protein [Defluviitaleaceae bacterium]|nr:nucleoid-associated protein [Defluviitaleaceae bacterium]
MAIVIRNAILHVLRNDGRESVFSEAELDFDSEICEAFIQKHVKKLIANPGVRTAHFPQQAQFYQLLGNYQSNGIYFKEMSREIAAKMDGIMKRFTDIPPCDLLVTRVGHKTGEYLAILKLNYHEVYASKSNNADNQLTKCTALPFSTGKVEYAALIGLDGSAMPINVTEKPATIDGNQVNYFSELFLECETAPSQKEQAKLIDEVTVEFVDEYCRQDPIVSAKIKTALVEESEEKEGTVSMDNVAAVAFQGQDEMKQKYVETMREAGVREDLPLGQRVVKQQFATHKIKAENGVEIRFPAELAIDEDEIEITTHNDGTVSVLLKRLRML